MFAATAAALFACKKSLWARTMHPLLHMHKRTPQPNYTIHRSIRFTRCTASPMHTCTQNHTLTVARVIARVRVELEVSNVYCTVALLVFTITVWVNYCRWMSTTSSNSFKINFVMNANSSINISSSILLWHRPKAKWNPLLCLSGAIRTTQFPSLVLDVLFFFVFECFVRLFYMARTTVKILCYFFLSNNVPSKRMKFPHQRNNTSKNK